MKEKFYFPSIFISIAFLLIVYPFTGYSQDNLIRDFGFNSNITTTNGTTYAVEVLNDATNKGKILVGGFFNIYGVPPGTSVPGKIVRLNPDGSVDNSFTAPTLNSYWGGAGGGIYTIAVQPWDGKTLIGGEFSINSSGKTFTNIARLNTNGSLDLTFNPSGGGTRDGGAFGKVTKILVLDPEKQIVIGGVLGSYNGTTIGNNKGGVLIVNENGSLFKDAKVTSTSEDWTGEGVTDMALAPDGKIVIAGEFGRVDTYLARRVARLNRDGSFDVTWKNDGYLGTGPSNHVTAVTVQPDGKILIGGLFDYYIEYNKSLGVTKQIFRTRIARLNVNGKLDNTFNYDAIAGTWLTRGFNAEVRDILVDSRDNILVAGLFTDYGGVGTSTGRIARLLSDGSLDTDFNAENFDGGVYAIAFQDWKSNGTYKSEAHLLAVGTFNKYDDVGTQQYAARFTIVPSSPDLSSSGGGGDPPTPTPTPLAKTISNFKVVKINASKNKLTWNALQTQTTYTVERSFDGQSFQKIASFYNTNADAALSYDDALSHTGKVHYRIVVTAGNNVSSASTTIEYTGVVTVNMLNGVSTNLALKEFVIDISISSNDSSNQTYNLYVLNGSGQRLLTKSLLMKNKTINETIWSTQSMKNCLVILKDSSGEVLKKVLFK
ncbi:delta-60 repeat domain-containing protein [Flavisolibacter tropicus]|uniref:Uncharacterized protein n=1 Tax=Flavisolibacter tropicus TaxID=1492898 RepID=A0A172TQZ5_9BACT|nr:delta-60 repeat domain-containing protein [Flavisolibacter tropicus]ANE49304.1 hypothetical protein SY85_01100 [Flavisolibacter tropicus]